MSLKKTEKIWHNGKLIRWDDANIHVLSHVVSYGSSVFEGIRCYETKQGPATFRVQDHMQRLVNSGHIYRMENPYSARPALRRRARSRARQPHDLLLHPSASCCAATATSASARCKCPIEVYIACWEWGAYLGPEALEEGVDVCVSSWTRMAPNTLPAMAKAGANYMNSQLIRMEAAANGYAEGIALDTNGYVSEGSGENIFLVQDGVVSHAAAGFERAARHHAQLDHHAVRGPGHPGARADDSARDAVHRRRSFLHRHRRRRSLRCARWTASQIGAGKRGPITKRLQEEFFAILTGSKARSPQLADARVASPVGASVALARAPDKPASRPRPIVEADFSRRSPCTADRKSSPPNSSAPSPSCSSARARSAPISSCATSGKRVGALGIALGIALAYGLRVRRCRCRRRAASPAVISILP